VLVSGPFKPDAACLVTKLTRLPGSMGGDRCFPGLSSTWLACNGLIL
jgi:hypothetical protein